MKQPENCSSALEAVFRALANDNVSDPYTIGLAGLLPDGTILVQLAEGKKAIVMVKEVE